MASQHTWPRHSPQGEPSPAKHSLAMAGNRRLAEAPLLVSLRPWEAWGKADTNTRELERRNLADKLMTCKSQAATRGQPFTTSEP